MLEPPNGAVCVSESDNLASCLRCCEYKHQVRLECANACLFVYDSGKPLTTGGPPVGLCAFRDDPALNDNEMCERYRTICKAKDGGGVICRSGRKVSCVWLGPLREGIPHIVQEIVISCFRANEDTHHDDVTCERCPGETVCRPVFRRGRNQRREECISDIASINCLVQRIGDCDLLQGNDRIACRESVEAMLRAMCGSAERNCGTTPYVCR